MRPVLRGLIPYEKLLDHTFDLADVADLNDALTIEDENTARAHAAAANRS